MIWVDYFIIGIIAISALIGVFRGFVREAFSLVVWIAAFWLAWTSFRECSHYLIQWISLPSARRGVALAMIMITVLVVGGIVNFLLAQLVEHTGLSGTDRLLGIFFGIGRGAIIIAIIILLAGLTALPRDPWWNQSLLIVYFQDLSIWLKSFLPDDIANHFTY